VRRAGETMGLGGGLRGQGAMGNACCKNNNERHFIACKRINFFFKKTEKQNVFATIQIPILFEKRNTCEQPDKPCSKKHNGLTFFKTSKPQPKRREKFLKSKIHRVMHATLS